MSYEKLPMVELTFKQVFGRDFPAGNYTKYPSKETSHFMISFKTPKRVVREFGFHATSGTIPPQMRMGGKIMFRLLDSKKRLVFERADNMQGFVNDEDVWPRATDVDVVTAANFEGRMGGRSLTEAPRPDWMIWLKPGRTYYLEVEREIGHIPSQPVPIKFSSFGVGGEVDDVPEEPAQPLEGEYVLGELESGGVKGTLIWKPSD